MKKWKIYEYPKCGSCQKALKFLEQKKIPYEKTDITVNPPSAQELAQMLEYYGGDVRKLFNTSGLVYKELKLSEKLPSLSRKEALALLAENGRLVKRPFVLGGGWGLLGFREEEWKSRAR